MGERFLAKRVNTKRKKSQFFLAAFKKSVFLQPIWMSNGVMAAQLTLDQLV